MSTKEKEKSAATFVSSGDANIGSSSGPIIGAEQRKRKNNTTRFASLAFPKHNDNVVGLKDGAMSSYSQTSWKARRKQFLDASNSPDNPTDKEEDIPLLVTIEEKERIARSMEVRNPLTLLFLGNLAALKVMLYFLISLETIITCILTTGLTYYWYYYGIDDATWHGGGMDFIILAFAVTSPIAAALGMAFTRREAALVNIADIRSFSHHLYLAHCIWDWPENGGRANCGMDLREHCDTVMVQLVGIGDELSRFLTLPTTSRGRHRMTRQGRHEAARTIQVAYGLLESMVTQRMARLSIYTERLKSAGLPSGEISRIRQYERFLENGIERLRMIKMYRTPQALRAFAHIFTFVLPPFYAPTYAQVAIEVQSLGVGIAFGLLTALGLSALFESLQVLEDPFVAYLALDGIDVREEFEVLLWSSLVNTRKVVFPDAPSYPIGRRAALSVAPERRPSTVILGLPSHHHRRDHSLDQPASEASFSTTLTPLWTNGLENADIEAAEFGQPIAEDVADSASVRESNFKEDG